MSDVALVVGAGSGLGAALGRRFAAAGMKVALARRDEAKLAPLLNELGRNGRGYSCDATDEAQVSELFRKVSGDLGTPSLVVFNAGAFVRKGILETTTADFERCWRVGCLGGFLVGREAAKVMVERSSGHKGTLIFTGATASLRGGARFHNLAVGKFGLRALAQSMARELQPQGMHVAHVIIDGQISGDRPGYSPAERGEDAVLDPAAIAETYYLLHQQPRSAWTLELDLRPYVEKF